MYAASCVVDALSIMRSDRIDVVVMDLHLPDLDGFAGLQRIRALGDARAAAVPVLALTAAAGAEDSERCLAAGFDGYLSKPVAVSALRQELARLLSRGAVLNSC